MRISVNLASRPFVELRPFFARLRIMMAALAVLAVGLFVAMHFERAKLIVAEEQMNAVKHRTVTAQEEKLRNESRMRQPANAAVLDRAHFLNALFLGKSFSWTAVMMDLETVLPTGVQVTAIEPQVTAEGDVIIRLRVSGDRDRAVQLVRNLERSKRFRAPRLANENAHKNDQSPAGTAGAGAGLGDVEFDILANYNPCLLEGLGPAADHSRGSAAEGAAKKNGVTGTDRDAADRRLKWAAKHPANAKADDGVTLKPFVPAGGAMSTAVVVPPPNSSSLLRRVPRLTTHARALLTAVNLHYAGVAALGVLNLYLAAHLLFLVQGLHQNDADAVVQQRTVERAAEIAAVPLRGLDVKLVNSTADADAFYRQRLPYAYSQVLAELGSLTKRENVRLSRVQYAQSPALSGAGELTEVRMDASMAGDYRPLVQLINAIERDRMFFVIRSLTFTGANSGQVNLRIRITTYLRQPKPEEPLADTPQATDASQNGGRAMKAGTENRNKTIAAAVLGTFALLYGGYKVYDSFFAGGPAPVPATIVQTVPVAKTTIASNASAVTAGGSGSRPAAMPAGNTAGVAAKKMATSSASLDPTLDQSAMLRTEHLVYSGSGRNIFSAVYVPPAAKLVQAKFPARPVAPVYVPPPQPSGPPPPPPINLKFFGTATRANGVRQAFLLQGEDVFLASQGDIVARRYRIVSISASSLQVEDMTNANTQTLPLQY